jgi:hypothetical protein
MGPVNLSGKDFQTLYQLADIDESADIRCPTPSPALHKEEGQNNGERNIDIRIRCRR